MSKHLIPPQQPDKPPSVRRNKFDAKDHDLRRTKVVVNLDQQSKDSLVVTLSIPLDASFPVEAATIRHFGTDILDIKYEVKMDFDVRRQEFDKQVRTIYGDERNEVLGKEELKPVTLRRLKEILAPLASLGANIFYNLFLNQKNGLLRPNVRHAEVVWAAITSVFSRPHLISIKQQQPPGVSSAPLFPWAFLYDDIGFKESDLSTLNPTRFWGFRHQIQEELDCTATRLSLPAKPSILTSICTDADWQQCHLHPAHSLSADKCNITEAPTVDELGTALKNFTHDCFYFFGHAHHPEPPVQTQSRLELRGEHLTVDELSRNYRPAPRFSKEPVLAFLNGCRTSPLNVWNKESVAGFLCEEGGQSVCCVSTVASVPGSVAAMFGFHFWKLFLDRKLPLGDALLKTRRVMLRKWNNPLGLLYTVFGNVDTCIER